MIKRTFKNRHLFQLFLLFSLFLTACSAQEGAEAEGVLYSFLSLMGLCMVGVLLMITTALCTVAKNDSTKTVTKIFSMIFLVGAAGILAVWSILLIDWSDSKAYYYGEGVFLVVITYLAALISFFATIVYVRKK